MAKDINIHLKTRGATETKRDLDKVGQSTEKMGDSVESTGRKTTSASDKILGGLKKIIGPLGVVALGTAIAMAAGKVAKFFDTIKTRSDEAVRQVQGLRAAYDSLFEALDAFDEKSRQIVTQTTNVLLQQTGVTKELGLPIINAYTRQFKGMVDTGQLTQEQYTQGLTGMLTYAARHGGQATEDLVMIAAGWGMTTPKQQGELRRMIARSAQLSGLTDAQVIGALGRGMPTIKAMGWTPAQAIENIAVIAAGEVGRKRMSLPATTLQGLMAPQLSDIEKLGIPEDVAQDPQKLLAYLQQKQGQISQQEYVQLLLKIYGTEAAAGVYKLTTAPRRGLSEALRQAAGGEGAAIEQAEEEGRKTTIEYRDAVTKAAKRRIELDITEQETFMEDVRDLGEAEQKRLQRKEPIRQYLREIYQPTEMEKEYAAYRLWLKSLTSEQRKAIRQKYPTLLHPEYQEWTELSPQEKWEILTGLPPETPAYEEPAEVSGYEASIFPMSMLTGAATGLVTRAGRASVTNNFYNPTFFFPVAGYNKEDLGIGPNAPRDLQ